MLKLDGDCTDLVSKALNKRLLINVTVENVIRLLPPLINTKDEADQICDIICSLVEET